MSTTTESAMSSTFKVSLKAGSLDDRLEQENKQLATALHELFMCTEALEKFKSAEVVERQAHQYRTALYFAAIARSKARDVLRDRGYPV
jgi:hypothetical protein